MEKTDPQGLSTQRRAIGLLLVDDHPFIRKGIIATPSKRWLLLDIVGR